MARLSRRKGDACFTVVPGIGGGNQRIALAPGFAATAEIKTGDRRIIEFLLSPLSRRLQEAGRER